MENNPIVKTEQETKSTYYNEVLAKRIRPKVTVEDLEMKEKKAENVLQDNQEKKGTPRKLYSLDEAKEKSTVYFRGDNLAANVWVNKYALKGF